MGQGFRTVVLLVGVGVVLSVGVVVVNQTAQVVQLASTVHPNLGTATLWTLVGVYAAAAGVPLVLLTGAVAYLASLVIGVLPKTLAAGSAP